MISIEDISINLEMREPGVWFAKSQSRISYPDDASTWCFEVEQQSFWFRHRNRCILTALKRFPPAGPLFDIGGGNGFVTKAIVDSGFDAVLVEPGIGGIRNAVARGLNPVICATLEDAGFRSQTLPAVGIFDVLEHIANEQSFLRTIHHLCIPGGRLYITTPAYSMLWSDEDNYAGHYRRYTKRKLMHALIKAGFCIEYMTYIFIILPFPIFLMRSVPYYLGLRRGIKIEREYREHRPMKGYPGHLMELLFLTELHAIQRGFSIPFGSSCLVIARK